MNKQISDVIEHAKLDKKAAKHDNDIMDDILEMLRARTKKNMAKAKGKGAEVEAARTLNALEESQLIIETEERELLQKQIDKIKFVVDEDSEERDVPLPTEEREQIEQFHAKLVQEMEEFNKTATLKVAGELHLERESLEEEGRVDLERDAAVGEGRDMFTQSYTNLDFKGKDSHHQKDGLQEPQVSDYGEDQKDYLKGAGPPKNITLDSQAGPFDEADLGGLAPPKTGGLLNGN